MASPYFPTPVGTQGNASGLPQVPAGARKIPQSLLNGVGRAIDSTRIVPTQGITIHRTPGGTGIDVDGIIQQAIASASATLLPFQVIPVGTDGNTLQCVINEGRVFGRVDWDNGKFYEDEGEAFMWPSLGVGPLDPSFTGVWPTETPLPDTTGSGAGGAKTPQGQTQVDGTMTGGGSGVVSTPLDPSKQGNAGYVSGNSGSVTSQGQQGGSYHTPLSKTGNGGYISGNAASDVYKRQVLV